MSTVPEAIVALADSLARIRTDSLAAAASCDHYGLVYATDDPEFLNVVEDYELSAMDAWLKGSSYVNSAGQTVAFAGGVPFSPTVPKAALALFEAYAKTTKGYAVSGTAPALSAYLAALSGARLPYMGAECFYDALSPNRFPAWQVFAKGVLPNDGAASASAGMHLFGTLTGPSTWAAGDGALPSTCGPVPIVAINQGSSQTVGATIRCTNWVGTATRDIALSLVSAAQYTQTVLGEQALSGGAAAGQKVIPVAATAQFTALEYVLLMEDGVTEVVKVASIVTNTSLTATDNLVNSFTTSAVAWPLFRAPAYQSGGSGTGDVAFYARPDRVITKAT